MNVKPGKLADTIMKIAHKGEPSPYHYGWLPSGPHKHFRQKYIQRFKHFHHKKHGTGLSDLATDTLELDDQLMNSLKTLQEMEKLTSATGNESQNKTNNVKYLVQNLKSLQALSEQFTVNSGLSGDNTENPLFMTSESGENPYEESSDLETSESRSGSSFGTTLTSYEDDSTKRLLASQANPAKITRLKDKFMIEGKSKLASELELWNSIPHDERFIAPKAVMELESEPYVL